MGLTVKEIEPLIHKKRGNVSAVARALRVSRQAIYNKVNDSSTLQAALENARETMLDNAETALYDEVLGGNTTAMIFFLKTQGKSRGYTERQEVEHSGKDGQPIPIAVVNVDIEKL